MARKSLSGFDVFIKFFDLRKTHLACTTSAAAFLKQVFDAADCAENDFDHGFVKMASVMRARAAGQDKRVRNSDRLPVATSVWNSSSGQFKKGPYFLWHLCKACLLTR